MEPKRTHLSFENLARFEPQEKRFPVYDDEIRNFMAFISPAGKPSFFITYNFGGKKRFFHIGPEFRRMSAIRKEAKKQEGRVASGIDIQGEKMAEREAAKAAKAERAAAKVNTLRTYVRDEYRPKKIDHQGRSGLETYRRLLQVWAPLMDIDMKTMPACGSRIEAIVAARLQKVTVHTAVREYNALNAVLNHAVEGGFLSANPIPSRKRLFGTIPSDKRVRYLSLDERARLNAALDDERTPGYFRVLVRLLLATGARRGEIFSLEWRDVDFADARITLRASNTKTKITRHVPLNSAALKLLREWHIRAVASLLVFPSPKTGGRLVTTQSPWRDLMQRADITGFNLHDCRHDFASQLVGAGVSLYEVSRLLGHSSIVLTERYSHLSPGHLRDAVEVLA